MKSTKENIVSRFEPCGCGCRGRDSWHRSEFRRVVRGVRSAEGFAQSKDLGRIQINAEATAQLPWGDTRVCRAALTGVWFVDHEDACRVQAGE